MTWHRQPLPMTWDWADDGEMCWRIRESGMPLDDEDAKMIRHLFDECDTRASVYDLKRLNDLCNQTIGFAKGVQVGYARRAAES